MTRVCSWCKQVIGERCARCSSTNVETNPALIAGQPARCYCRDCHQHFDEGDGGPTHGICDRCKATPEAERVNDAKFVTPKRWEELGDHWITWLAGDAKAVALRAGCSLSEAIEALTRLTDEPGFGIRLANAARGPQRGDQ
jgi:hypothetical protein